MPKGRIYPTRRALPDSVRRRLEVVTAMAWESIVETHVQNARQFIQLLRERLPLEDALARYTREMDLTSGLVQAVSTRVLENVEAAEDNGADGGTIPLSEDGDQDREGWRRFRPDVVVKGVLDKQRRAEETERWIELLIAKSEEALILTHLDGAITFAALLEEHMPFSRAVAHYLDALALTGGRAQAVSQRTMARLADVHLPAAAAWPRPRPKESDSGVGRA